MAWRSRRVLNSSEKRPLVMLCGLPKRCLYGAVVIVLHLRQKTKGPFGQRRMAKSERSYARDMIQKGNISIRKYIGRIEHRSKRVAQRV
jgi:hypothetical protein